MTDFLIDIGGTYIRICPLNSDSSNDFKNTQIYQTSEFSSFDQAIQHYFESTNINNPKQLIIAVACPVSNNSDTVELSKLGWLISKKALKSKYGFTNIQTINDFSANAMAIPYLKAKDLIPLNGSFHENHLANTNSAVIGAGTGLGTAAIVSKNVEKVVISSEAGQKLITYHSVEQENVIKYLKRSIEYVTAEHLLSGPGLENIYQAINQSDEPLPGIEITKNAHNNEKSLNAIRLFTEFLGLYAADICLSFNITGGVFITGGMIHYIKDVFQKDDFLKYYQIHSLIDNIPAFIIKHPLPSFIGMKSMIKN